MLSEQNKEKVCFYDTQMISLFNFNSSARNIKDFVKMVEEISETIRIEKSGYINVAELVNNFKGDVFEVFAEIFFKTFNADPTAGLGSYSPAESENDHGVDGIGINPMGHKCAVQIKYRSDMSDTISYSSMTNVFFDGVVNHGLDLQKKNSIFLFTTCKGLNSVAANQFNHFVKVINHEVIDFNIKENVLFWKNAHEFILNALTDKCGYSM